MNVNISKYEKVLCAYCGSVLTLSKHGRCSYCEGPYSYVIVREEKKFELVPSEVGQVNDTKYSINTFYSDLIEYNDIGIIVGGTYTGKTPILANFVNTIDESLSKVVITPEPWEFNKISYAMSGRVTPNTGCSQLRSYTIDKLRKYDVIVIDDFDIVFRYDGDVTTLPQLAKERMKFLAALNGKPLLLSIKRMYPYLEYRAKWVAEVKDRNLIFTTIKGQKIKGN